MHYLYYTSRDRDLGHHVANGIEEAHGYIRLVYTILHPHIITLDEDVHFLRTTKQEAFNEIAAKKEGEHEYLELIGRLGHVRDHVLSVMSSGVDGLEKIPQEVHGRRVYCRRHGRGGRGPKATC